MYFYLIKVKIIEILQLQCQLYRKIFPCLNYTSKYINDRYSK